MADMIKVEMTYEEARALLTCAEVGYAGADENISARENAAARGGLNRLRAAVEPSACPTYEAFNGQGHAVRVTIPESEK